MDHRTLALTAATLLAIMGSVVAATAGQAAASCAPGWELRAAPPAPGSNWLNPMPVPGGQDTAGAQPGLSLVQEISANSLDSISAIAPDDVMITGETTVPSQVPWTLHWDGRSLSTATQAGEPQSPFGESVSSFDSGTGGWEVGAATDAHGTGSAPLAERWHDGRWTVMPTAVVDVGTSGTQAGFTAVKAISPDNAWLAGTTMLPGFGGPAGTLIEHWDGTQWSVVPSPASAAQGAMLSALTVVAANDIWAVGRQTDSNGNTAPLALHWNGVSWQQVAVPAGNGGEGVLTAVSAAGPGDVWAVGSQPEKAGSTLAAPLAEHWDGSAWSPASLPDLGNAQLSGVYAAGHGDVWATESASALQPSVFVHLDGAKGWTTVPTPGPLEYGVSYSFTQISGTGPDDVWALGGVLNLGAATDSAIVAHLGCGADRRS